MHSQIDSFIGAGIQKSAFGKSYAFTNLSTSNTQIEQNEITKSRIEKPLFSSFYIPYEKTSYLDYNYIIAKTFKSPFNINKYMEGIQSPRQKRIYSTNEIRQYFKENYRLEVSENPTEKEQKRMLYAWADKMNRTASNIIAKQDATLSELESTLKEIRELKQKNK